MSRISRILFLVLALGVAHASPAAETSPERSSQPISLAEELAAARAAHADELTRLQAAFATSTDDAAALEIQRRIEDLHRARERGLLSIQLRQARLRGEHEVVTQLQRSLEALERLDEASKRTEGQP